MIKGDTKQPESTIISVLLKTKIQLYFTPSLLFQSSKRHLRPTSKLHLHFSYKMKQKAACMIPWLSLGSFHRVTMTSIVSLFGVKQLINQQNDIVSLARLRKRVTWRGKKVRWFWIGIPVCSLPINRQSQSDCIDHMSCFNMPDHEALIHASSAAAKLYCYM